MWEGTEAEPMEGCCLLAYSSWLAQPALLCTPRLTTCPRMAPAIVDLAPLHQSLIKKCPTAFLQASLVEAFSQLRFLLR